MDKWLKSYAESKNITSKYSLNSMKSNLKRIEKVTGKKIEQWKAADFKNPEAILDKIIEDYSLNTALVTMNAIKMWLMMENASAKIIDEYTEYIKDLSHEKDETVKKQQKNSLEEELGENFDFKRLQKTVRDYVSKNLDGAKGNELVKLLLISLFTLQPPTRIGNYLNMEIRRGDGKRLGNDKNYLMVKDGKYKFIFNKYKTSKHLGKTELPVTDPLLEKVISKHIEGKNGRTPIFLEKSQTHVTQLLNSITKKILDVPISVNVLRHSFLTDFMNSNPSIAEKERVAKIVGQTYKVPRMEKYARVE